MCVNVVTVATCAKESRNLPETSWRGLRCLCSVQLCHAAVVMACPVIPRGMHSLFPHLGVGARRARGRAHPLFVPADPGGLAGRQEAPGAAVRERGGPRGQLHPARPGAEPRPPAPLRHDREAGKGRGLQPLGLPDPTAQVSACTCLGDVLGQLPGGDLSLFGVSGCPRGTRWGKAAQMRVP